MGRLRNAPQAVAGTLQMARLSFRRTAMNLLFDPLSLRVLPRLMEYNLIYHASAAYFKRHLDVSNL